MSLPSLNTTRRSLDDRKDIILGARQAFVGWKVKEGEYRFVLVNIDGIRPYVLPGEKVRVYSHNRPPNNCIPGYGKIDEWRPLGSKFDLLQVILEGGELRKSQERE